MLTLYVIPLHPISFPAPVFRITHHSSDVVAEFVEHMSDCLCCITFAGVEPDFSEFVPDGVYVVVPLEGEHAAR